MLTKLLPPHVKFAATSVMCFGPVPGYARSLLLRLLLRVYDQASLHVQQRRQPRRRQYLERGP